MPRHEGPGLTYHRSIRIDELVAPPAAAPRTSAQPVRPHVAGARPRVPLELVGLIGVVVAFLAIGGLFAVQQPPFYDADEKAHLAYAHEIASLRLPEIDTIADPPAAAVQWHAELATAQDERYLGVWVANHPPLHYIASAPLVWLAEATDRADGGLLYLRLLNLTFAAGGLVFVFLVGTHVARGNRRVGLLATALVALVPQCYTYFSRALNDGLAFAAASGVLFFALRCARPSPARRDLVAMAALVAVAAGTRAATMLMAAAVVVAVAGYHLVRTRSAPRDRARAAARIAAIGLGPAAVLWGWFYVRNHVLYGDVGASSYLLERFQRSRVDSVAGMLTQGHVWSSLYRRLASTAPLDWAVPRFATLVAVVCVVAVAVLGASGVRRRDRRLAVDATVLLVAIVVVVVTVAQHLAGGGSPYPRYLFPALGAAAVLVAAGLERVGRGVVGVVGVAVLGGWLATRVPIGVDATTLERPRDHGPPPPALQTLPAGDAVRIVLAVVATAAAATVIAVLTASVGLALAAAADARRHGAPVRHDLGP